MGVSCLHRPFFNGKQVDEGGKKVIIAFFLFSQEHVKGFQTKVYRGYFRPWWPLPDMCYDCGFP